MIWIVLVSGLLFIAMLCVALWYREKWQGAERERDLAERKRNNCVEENHKLQAMVNFWRRSWNDRGEIVEELTNEVEQLKGELADTEVKCRQFRDHINILRQQLPARDSKGRFCKKTIV